MKDLNWLITIQSNDIEYKNFKCRNCGNIIAFKPNNRSKTYQKIAINLDNSPHRCYKNS